MKKEMKTASHVLVSAAVILCCLTGCSAGSDKLYEVPQVNRPTASDIESAKKEAAESKANEPDDEELTIDDLDFDDSDFDDSDYNDDDFTYDDEDESTYDDEGDFTYDDEDEDEDDGSADFTVEPFESSYDQKISVIDGIDMFVTFGETYSSGSAVDFTLNSSLSYPVWLDSDTYKIVLNGEDITNTASVYLAVESNSSEDCTVYIEYMNIKEGDILEISGDLRETENYDIIGEMHVEINL